MSDELKECPFCNEDQNGNYEYVYDPLHITRMAFCARLVCESCGASAPFMEVASTQKEAEAIADTIWNTRANPLPSEEEAQAALDLFNDERVALMLGHTLKCSKDNDFRTEASRKFECTCHVKDVDIGKLRQTIRAALTNL